MRSGDPRTAQDGDPLGGTEDVGGPPDRLVVGAHDGSSGPDRAGRPAGLARALQEDLAGDDDDRHAVILDRCPHGHLEDARRHLGGADQLAVDTALAEQILRVGFLEVFGADLGTRNVGSDGQHGHAAALRIEQPVDQVQIARAATARAHGQLTGQRGVGGRGEGGGLLVPNVLPGELAAAADRVGESVEAVTGKSVDPSHPAQRQRRDDLVCNGRHDASPVCDFGVIGGGRRR
ncbi:hypothetical protein BN975_01241 [Mycolicibacterium farcinogenes]|nr:hypothetical protein BN975_01241 [Mycolicibacterium farcinogenes]